MANGAPQAGLLGALTTGKNAMLEKMPKIPPGYTHVGLAKTELGMTVIVASEVHQPLIAHPQTRQWMPLQMKTQGGLLIGKV